VNSQNVWYESAENPRLIHKFPVSGKKVGAISEHMIIGPIFYNDTVNAARYVGNILLPFFDKLAEEKAKWCFPARFCKSSHGICKFRSTAQLFW
jgi:hypothetical protein